MLLVGHGGIVGEALRTGGREAGVAFLRCCARADRGLVPEDARVSIGAEGVPALEQGLRVGTGSTAALHVVLAAVQVVSLPGLVARGEWYRHTATRAVGGG